MQAVDTNVLVRFLMRDDAAQTQRATSLLSNGLVWISKTVLLETAWVLRGSYGFSNSAVNETLKRLVGMPNVRLEEPFQLAKAFDWAAGGIDFADALHLASSPDTARFVTFDIKLAKRAKKLNGVSVFRL